MAKVGRATGSRITVAICFLAAIFEGVDLQAAGVAAPHLLPLLKLTPSQAGIFFSASTVGLLIGAPVGGRLADRFGRKGMLLASIVVFGLFALATALVGDFRGLVAMRFLTGLGLGGAMPNMIALASESAPARDKGFAVALMYAGMPFGGALASLISLTAGADWKSIFYVGGVAPLLLAPVILFALTDSYRTRHGDPDPAADEVGALKALFGQSRARVTPLLWVAFGFTLLVLYLLLNWLPSLLISRGFSKPTAAAVQIVFNLAGAAAGILAGRLIDGRHRLIVVALSFGATLAGLWLLAAMPADTAVALAVGALAGVGILSNQAILYALSPQGYPAPIRGTGVGAAVAVGRVGSLIGPIVAGQLVGAGQSASQVLTHMLPIILIGAVAALALAATSPRQEPESYVP